MCLTNKQHVMAQDASQKSTLSKNVLQMKFMQRSALRIEKEQNEEEKQRVIDDEHWVLDLPETKQNESKYVFEPSCVIIDSLRFGRMSFNGCNKDIEKLMKIQNTEIDLEASERKEKEGAVDEEEMAERYESLIGTISKKFSKKRQRSEISADDNDSKNDIEKEDDSVTSKKKRKKQKFLKPKDD